MSTSSPPSAQDAADERRAWRLLAAGALAGAVLGVVAARSGGLGPGGLPPGAIASVDGRPVLREEYERAVSMVAGDRREPPDAEERAHVLARLVDEALLVQHALASGLLASDRGVRDTAVRTLVESVVADGASRVPAEEDLRAAYAKEQATRTGPLPPFEAERGRLEQAYAERAREAALRVYLDELRSRARIRRLDGAQR